MRHTILIATLSSVAASVLTTAVISGSLFGADAASSADTPAEAEGALSPGGVTSILQGDLNCDGVVDTHDTLGGLRFVGELDVAQTEPCPDVGTLAAIPGPAGPAGPQGPAGPAGPGGPAGARKPGRNCTLEPDRRHERESSGGLRRERHADPARHHSFPPLATNDRTD